MKKISGFESTYKNAPADVKKILDALDFMEDYGKLEKARKSFNEKRILFGLWFRWCSY